MSELTKKPNNSYTYGDLLQWPEDERWELIDGVPYNMSPGPTTQHQRISRELMRQISNYLVGKTCEVFGAPFDVLLGSSETSEEEIDKVVQPDIFIVCDKTKLGRKSCKGAPDLIIEIISPSTAKKDMIQKLNLYQKYGVKEYWIVDPAEQDVSVLTLKEDKMYDLPITYKKVDKIKVEIFEDLEIDLKEVFTE